MKVKTKSKARKAWNVVRSTDGQTATIELYGDIVENRPRNGYTGEPSEKDYIIPSEIQKDLDDVKNCQTVDIHINSAGGEVYAAVAIYNKIKSFTGNVTTIIDGIAASAASVVAMAGKTVKISTGALFMIHNPSCFLFDYMNIDDLKKAENVLEATTNAIAGIYSRKTGKSEDEIRDLMAAETWMTDQEAVDFGFADEIEEGNDVQVTMSMDHKMIMAAGRQFDVHKCVNLPKNLKIGDTQPSGQALHHIEDKEDKKSMDLNEFKEKNPDLYNSLMNEAKKAVTDEQSTAIQDAVNAEDERIKAIDEIAGMCSPEMVNEAKYGEHRCSAADLAFRAIKAQKEAQTKMHNSIIEDVNASGVNDVKPIGNNGNTAVKPVSMETEVTEIVEKMKGAAK